MTTLVNMMAGLIAPDRGRIVLKSTERRPQLLCGLL
jgi:ABC-type sulfate/molybdate transport systems ATPase subunit